MQDLSSLDEEQKLRLAQEPTTAPSVLSVLAIDESLAVQRAVTLNPNTPLTQLLALAVTFPAEFCQNPALPLFLIEDPGLVQRLSWKLINQLAEVSGLPDFLLHALANSSYEHIQAKLASNPGLEPDTLERFLLGENPKTRFKASQNPAAPRDLLEDLYRAGSDRQLQGFLESPPDIEEEVLTRLSTRGVWARVVVAHHPQTQGALLEELSRDENALVRATVAARDDAPEELLRALFADADERVQAAAAQNPRLPKDLLEQLVSKEIPSLWGVLESRAPTEEALAQLTQEDARLVRRTLAKHPNLTEELLDKLSKDPDEEVRLLVAAHEGASLECLTRLARDDSPKVRQAVAKNPNASPDLISFLRGDADPYVKKEAAKAIEATNPVKKRHHSKPAKPRRKK